MSTLTIAKLNHLRSHATYHDDLALIDSAEAWLAAFQQECAATWQEPDQVEIVAGAVQFTWFGAGSRGFSVDIAPQGITTTKMYDEITEDDIEDYQSALATQQARIDLWRWYREEKQP